MSWTLFWQLVALMALAAFLAAFIKSVDSGKGKGQQ